MTFGGFRVFLALAYWSLWVRVPAYVVGFAAFVIYLAPVLWSKMDGDKKPGQLPTWAWFLITIASIQAFYAYVSSWDERNVVAAFIANWAAQLLYFGIPVGGIAIGALTGMKLDRTLLAREEAGYGPRGRLGSPQPPKLRWLSWLTGIVVAVVVVGSLSSVARKIPGMAWRMDRITEESDDHDDDLIRR